MARAGVPHPCDSVLTPSDKAFVVGTERHTQHVACAIEGKEFLPHLSIPNSARHEDSRTVGCKRHAAYRAGLSIHREKLLAFLDVPHLCRVVRASTEDLFAVRAECRAHRLVRVPLEGEDFLACRGIPTLTVASARDDSLAVR